MGVHGLGGFATIGPGDTSGSDTYARYRYQTKLAAQFWLTTLQEGGPSRVVVEYQEDIVLVHEDGVWCIGVTHTVTQPEWLA